MKKSTLFIICFLTTQIILFTQDVVVASAYGQNKFKYGITTGKSLEESDNFFGFNVGFVGERTFSKNVYGNVAIVYENRFVFFGDGFSALFLPINAGYKFQIKDKTHIFGELGVRIGYGFGYNYETHFLTGIGLKAGINLSDKYKIHIGRDYTFAKGEEDYKSIIIGFTFFF